MIKELAKDLYWLELPMRGSPLGTVNCYIIKGQERSLLVDAGCNTDECYGLLQQSMKQLEIKADALDIFLTHGHSDHIGLCNRITNHNTTVYMNKQEFSMSQEASSPEYWLAIENYFQRNGWPQDEQHAFVQTYADRLMQHFEFNCPVSFVQDGDLLQLAGQTRKVLLTPGHSKEHLSLLAVDQQVLFVGDTLIENFYPILYYRDSQVDMLGSYLSSIEKLRETRAKLVLAGHKQPMYELDKSCNKASNHYKKIKKKVMDNLGREQTCAFTLAKSIYHNNWQDSQLRKKWFYMANVLTTLTSLACHKQIKKTEKNGQIFFSL